MNEQDKNDLYIQANKIADEKVSKIQAEYEKSCSFSASKMKDLADENKKLSDELLRLSAEYKGFRKACKSLRLK